MLKPEECRSGIERKSILAALQNIGQELRSLIRLLGPVQQAEDTIGAQNSATDEHTTTNPPATVLAITQRTNAEIREHEADRQSDRNFQRKSLTVQWCLFISTILAFGAAAYYAHIARLQKDTMDQTLREVQKQTRFAENSSKAATDAAHIAHDALEVSRDQFRQDQRPYIAMAPAGDVLNLRIAQGGAHTGNAMVEFHVTNYGKSPAIESTREAHVLIGREALSRIGAHWDRDTAGRIIPPGDHPSVYGFSDRNAGPEIFTQVRNETTPVVVYGRIEYTDMFGDPKPHYVSGFCFALRNGNPDTERACKGQNYIQ